MGRSGTLDIQFSHCDIPINQLFVSVYVPDNYKYGEFTGMREVQYWSGTPPTSVAAPQQQQQLRSMDMMSQVQSSNIMWEPKRKTAMKMEKEDRRGGHVRGVLPVKVDVPQTGKVFYFQQLLGKKWFCFFAFCFFFAFFFFWLFVAW